MSNNSRGKILMTTWPPKKYKLRWLDWLGKTFSHVAKIIDDEISLWLQSCVRFVQCQMNCKFRGSGKAEEVSGWGENQGLQCLRSEKCPQHFSLWCTPTLPRAFWDNLYTFEIQSGQKRGHKVEKWETFALPCNLCLFFLQALDWSTFHTGLFPAYHLFLNQLGRALSLSFQPKIEIQFLLLHHNWQLFKCDL